MKFECKARPSVETDPLKSFIQDAKEQGRREARESRKDSSEKNRYSPRDSPEEGNIFSSLIIYYYSSKFIIILFKFVL